MSGADRPQLSWGSQVFHNFPRSFNAALSSRRFVKIGLVHSGFDGLKFTTQTEISPELREKVASAKAHAKETFSDCILEFEPVSLRVSGNGAHGFTTNTGDHVAVWLFQDLEDPFPNNPGFTIYFRAFGLAISGLEGAEAHFRDCKEALGVK